MTMKAVWLVAALMPGACWALPHSDAWCADAVDFAMRTAERRDEGKTREFLAQAIRDNPQVFQQQYPDLQQQDMQNLVLQVFEHRWSRFNAARATAQACTRERMAAISGVRAS